MLWVIRRKCYSSYMGYCLKVKGWRPQELGIIMVIDYKSYML
jgi:hypothetical protein